MKGGFEGAELAMRNGTNWNSPRSAKVDTSACCKADFPLCIAFAPPKPLADGPSSSACFWPWVPSCSPWPPGRATGPRMRLERRRLSQRPSHPGRSGPARTPRPRPLSWRCRRSVPPLWSIETWRADRRALEHPLAPSSRGRSKAPLSHTSLWCCGHSVLLSCRFSRLHSPPATNWGS